MNAINQAIILTGGAGKRLDKITKLIPKPLIKLNNEPFIHYLINFLIKNNLKKILLLAGYKGHKFIKLKKKYKNIKIIIEKKPLGTGGAIINSLKYCNKRFVLLNGDSYFNLILKNRLFKFNQSQEKIFFLTENINYKSNKKLSNLEINKKKKIIYKKKGKGLMYGGISILNKKDFSTFEKNKFISLETDIVPNWIKNSKILGERSDSFFIDIGTKKNLNYAKNNFKKKIKNKCIFFDRDNTLIYDKGYTYKKKDLHWKPGAIKALKYLNQLDYLVIIITNQSGVARKYYTENDVVKFHEHMNNKLRRHKAIIDDFFYCPFHKDGFGKYKKNSIDRKPNNGMVIKAIKKWNIDVSNSFFIGDKKIDQITAKKSKIKFYKSNKNLFFLVRDLVKKMRKANKSND